jgi:ankyrin repeat protein
MNGNHVPQTLHNAAAQGDVEAVEDLLNSGAAVDSRVPSPIDRRKALHFAAEGGHLGVMQLLLGHGASVHAESFSEDTALHWAAKGGHLGAVQLLVDFDADVNAANLNGDTALHLAAEEGHTAVMQVLLGAGSDVNSINHDRQTALCAAASNGHTAAAQLLLAAPQLAPEAICASVPVVVGTQLAVMLLEALVVQGHVQAAAELVEVNIVMGPEQHDGMAAALFQRWHATAGVGAGGQ